MTPPPFPLARGARLTASAIGDAREPVLQADDLLADPGALVAVAAASRFEPAYGPAGGYPGLRSALPEAYIRAVVNALVGPIAEAFALGRVRPVGAQGAFSLVTQRPDALLPPQRAPHVDAVHPMQFAILHYLCDAAHGGTAFYRHRATGFEVLSDARLPAYTAARAGEGTSAGYIDGDDGWFVQTARVDAAVNRLVVYRSALLHSGLVPAPERLRADPRTGRLTANVFVTLAPD
ncbi:DUF6445 family protein [Sphingomonas sp. A2-49]|uniref:DUF6445 family protein n=1 Tax=Sphingomonas sp. A2-49 TaxID=1391375 RepID=UPI0021D0F0E8|nr:DUF6445 family protein [Sphingomonas sp. A2-49]MCU6455726.1 DUF6445 family protein [Sphingomonas sp. A2-49]